MLLLSLAACSAIIPSKNAISDVRLSEREDVAVHAERIARAPGRVQRALGEDVVVESVFALSSPHKSFGGLSGLWVAPDGGRLLAVSDIGQLWQARMRHDDTGRLTGLDDWSVADLTRQPGDGSDFRWIDSEALAVDAEGGLVVAYEGQHRLRRWTVDGLDDAPESLTLPHGLGAPSNSGIEALSTLDNGRLFALAERVGAWGGGGLMGWIIDGSTASDFVYVPGPGFAPTGAARLDETVYVVERSFSLLGGFRTRIVTLETRVIEPRARLEGAELADFRWGDIGENFEAISARRGTDGRVHLYLLADDNFFFFQETLLVQLSLPETSAKPDELTALPTN